MIPLIAGVILIQLVNTTTMMLSTPIIIMSIIISSVIRIMICSAKIHNSLQYEDILSWGALSQLEATSLI